MPFATPPPAQAGGWMELEYSNPLVGERHMFHMHLAQFESVGFTYTGIGPKAPTEVSVAQTFAALAARWAPYYHPSWQLRLVGMVFNSGGLPTPMPTVPMTTPVSGSEGSGEYLGPSARRIFRMTSTLENKRRVYLMQVLGSPFVNGLAVTPSEGGIDARDRALVAYLSSPASGTVAPDGFPFLPTASLRVWWARPLEAVAPPAGPGPFVVSG